MCAVTEHATQSSGSGSRAHVKSSGLLASRWCWHSLHTNCAILPDLRGRLPIHQGTGPGLSNYVIGQVSGTETVTLNTQQMPAHTHGMIATTAASTALTPGTNLLPGTVSGDVFYATDLTGATPAPMATQSTTVSGGSQPHDNTE